MNEMIVVIDLGGHYNQIIARRVRDLGVYSEIHPYTISAEEVRALNPKGIILAGSAAWEETFRCDAKIFELNLPILAIGSGMQQLSEHYGIRSEKTGEDEYKKVSIKVENGGKLFLNTPETQIVWMNEGARVNDIPGGFVKNAADEEGSVAAMSDEARRLYGAMFHPEADGTEFGNNILRNFIYEICQCEGNWSMKNFIDIAVENIRQEVGNKKVLCALSGGVDSSVVAALVHKAIGDQLTCMFIDHGLLRKGEPESVMKTFGEKFRMNVIKIDAQERFLRKLKGVSDPEQKRIIIGNEFIYVFDEEAAKLSDIEFLAQGTIYTDIIESGTATNKVVKSHHNVGGLPKDMKFKLVEPLKMLFKDEVRRLGTELGLPEEIVWRQPFPGPGLGVRVLGEVTEEKLTIARESDAILREEIKKAGLERDIWQYFTVVPDFRSVGVKGDGRTYEYMVGIRAVKSVDGLTSDWARIPYDVLEKISTRITNEVEHVNRVVFDITSKPPATIEWE